MLFRDTIKDDPAAQKLVREWIDALRSGKYEQCQGVLHKPDDGFCCLGVVLDLIDPTWLPYPVGKTTWQTLTGMHAYLPPSIVVKLHLSNEVGAISGAHTSFDTLTGMNDGGVTFARIADKIEEQLNTVLAR